MNELERVLMKRQDANEKKGVLDRRQVLRIKRGLEAGDKVDTLARLFGVSYQTITRIRDGKTWGWVMTDEEVIATPRVGVEVPKGRIAASLADVMKRINEGQTGGDDSGSGLAALGAALEKEKRGETALEELIGDRAKGLKE